MSQVLGPFSAVLEELFTHAKRLSGISFRWKDADPHLRLSMPRHLVEHRDEFCIRIKGLDRPSAVRCRKHCALDPERWLKQRMPQRCSTCHAGVVEIREPLFKGCAFLGCLVMGPFNTSSGALKVPDAYACADDLLALVMSSIRRLGTERDLERNALSGHGLHPALGRCLQYVSSSMHGESIEEIAAYCGISASRLQHLCTEQIGEPLRVLCDRSLLHRAQGLLRDEQLSVSYVAHNLGFRDQRYFATWFKRLCAQTPSAWRRQQVDPI